MPSPATPHQLAMYGHIAAALRAALKAKGWTIPDLSQALGKGRADAGPYHWLNGKGGPTAANAEKLSKLFGIPIAELQPRKVPVTFTLDRAKPPPMNLVPVSAAPRAAQAGDVLSFTVNREGVARIKLDAVLPLDQATPLLRMLLDAGLVMGDS